MVSNKLLGAYTTLLCLHHLLPTQSLQTLLPTPPPPTTPNSNPYSLQNLNQQSTALDVLKTLHTNDGTLAPYIQNGGGTAVVTGGNSGIGAISVETLALAGMSVVLCSRSKEAGDAMIAQMKMTNGVAKQIRVQVLDLADLASVERAAVEIGETEGRIDLLLNNAGVMATPQREETKQGFELQLGTNHVGHHMLTRLLLPRINQGGRVVTVASTAHSFGSMDFQNLNYNKNRLYTPWGAYGQSKLANILFAKGLDDRLKGSDTNISSLSLHPGVISTNLWQYSPWFFRPFANLMADKTVEQGAATSMFCCLADCDYDAFGIVGGDYVMDCQVSTPNEKGQDEDGTLRNQLWDETEDMITQAGFDLPEELV